jgi:tetratricopeptide (TPR) repeat protein
MRKIFLLLIIYINSLAAVSQQPQLRVSDRDSGKVLLQKLKVDVKIAGQVATTTLEMQFCNRSNRILEGELVFPLPEGVSVSRYALDINGKLREAVPVEREKGQVVFESIVRQKVDPGLLEKTEGNNFRTRLYPLPANGCRTVVIAYEQELKRSEKNTLVYSLPLSMKKTIPVFESHFTVYSQNIPELGSDCGTGIQFKDGNQVFEAHSNNKNFKPTGSFQLYLPPLTGGSETIMEEVNGQYYFLINTWPETKAREKKIPGRIGLVWDVSLSGRERDHAKEFELLDRYFKKAGNVQVALGTIGFDYTDLGTFNVSGGNWQALREKLEKITYDGATRLGALNRWPGADEYFLFSDGMNTWGQINLLTLPGKPIHTVCAATQANHGWLRDLSARSAGTFINLAESNPEAAEKSLTTQTLHLLQVQVNGQVSEVYPSVSVPIEGNCAVSGISTTPQSTVTLVFGYGSEIAFTKTIQLDYKQQESKGMRLDKIWAQKKIAQLDVQYDAFKNVITDLGKRYGLVTRNTSLIVLDDVADYVRFDIEPPAELKAEYATLQAQKIKTEQQTRQRTADAALKYYQEVIDWWNKPFKPTRKVVTEVFVNRDSLLQRGFIGGRVLDSSGQPLAGASVVIRGTNRGVATNNEGAFNIPRGNTNGVVNLTISYVGFRTVSVALGRNENMIEVKLNPSLNTQQEVVVTRAQNNNWANGDTRMNYESLAGQVPGTYAMTDSARLPSRSISQGYAANGNVVTTSAAFLRVPNVDRASARIAQVQFTPPVLARRYSFSLSQQRTSRSSRDDFFRRTNASPDPIRNTMAGSDFAYQWAFGDSARRSLRDSVELEDIGATEPGFDAADLSPKRMYLSRMDSMGSGDLYAEYIKLRDSFGDQPSFYFDMAGYFHKKEQRDLALKILSNIADMGIEDYELYKMLGFQLRAWNEYDEAVLKLGKVLEWRPQEPQSYRDYGLALTDAGKYQQAVDTLYAALLRNFDENVSQLYPGIEEVIVTEINRIVALHAGINTSRIDKRLLKPVPVDLRVVLNWNRNDTDIDLWVTDPNQETCMYSHRKTLIGGRISRDFTRGYGPEQFMLKKALSGKYRVELHYFGDNYQKIAGPATIQAEVFTNFGQANEKRTIVTLQMEKESSGQQVLIGEFEVE